MCSHRWFSARSSMLAAVLATAACGSVRRTGTAATAEIGDNGASHVQLTVHNLSKPEADLFLQQVSDQGRVETAKLLTWDQNTAVYELDLKGCECELP